MIADSIKIDTLNVIHANATNLGVHEMQITTATRSCRPSGKLLQMYNSFTTSQSGLELLTDWPLQHQADTDSMDTNGTNR